MQYFCAQPPRFDGSCHRKTGYLKQLGIEFERSGEVRVFRMQVGLGQHLKGFDATKWEAFDADQKQRDTLRYLATLIETATEMEIKLRAVFAWHTHPAGFGKVLARFQQQRRSQRWPCLLCTE